MKKLTYFSKIHAKKSWDFRGAISRDVRYHGTHSQARTRRTESKIEEDMTQ